MVLTTIFLIRHGFRSNWTTDPNTGEISSRLPSPTGIPSDPALSAHGAAQAEELGTQAELLDPPVVRIYTSPFYRCVQTIRPFALRLPGVPVILDRGIGEWYGVARWDHPSPAPVSRLQPLFPDLELRERVSIVPSCRGETLEELHGRSAYALSRIIADVDGACEGSGGEESIALVSHAATLIAVGRALTGRMPADVNEVDLHTHTASISTFRRRKAAAAAPTVQDWADGEPVPDVGWTHGRGVGGGWDCVVNAATANLSGGEERDWHFTSDESFIKDTGKNRAPMQTINGDVASFGSQVADGCMSGGAEVRSSKM